MKSEFTRPTETLPSSAAETASTSTLHHAVGAAALHLAGLRPAGADPLERLNREVLLQLGENPDREGLLSTPKRVARALRFLTTGYEADIGGIVNGALFDAEGYREMVLVKDVEFYSLCEHHMLPFFGTVSVAYLPGEKIIGLSKIPRLVDAFARRLQVQERMTSQLAEVLEEILAPKGVAIYASGFHLCMAMRGVKKQSSRTTTQAFTGDFRTDPHLRREFLSKVE